MKRLCFSALIAAQLIPLALCQKIFPADLALPEAKPPVIQPVQIIGNQRVEGRIGRHTFFCAPVVREPKVKYVDVILAEAEQTDGMVLEMLDLSRLEAGKVKLSRDEFSLADLTKAIFEKLQMAAEAKELQISYEFPEQSTIVADENRIAQVVENFATNAVKYTPAGGSVTVRIQNNRGKTTFSIENDSDPLSDEALAKVWDTFYRVDESRSGGGTGLGLAIAKNIVELHGGKCSVRNTKTGVEFGFSL